MEMAVTLRRLFPAFLLLFFSGNALSARRCADCGSTPVPYPLSTGPDCGDQLYKIRCNGGGGLVFDTLNNTYGITSIIPKSQRLTIEPAPFLRDTCVTEDISTGGILLNSSLPFNITSSNTILYLNCTDALLGSPLNCSSNSACHVYINGSLAAGDGVGACANAPLCCSLRAGGSSTADKIRVRMTGCRAYRAFVNLDESLPVGRWPKPALELEWASPPEPLCGSQLDCDSGSTCRLDGNSGRPVSRCFCDSGSHWDPILGSCARNVCKYGCGNDKTGLIAGLSSGLGVAFLAATLAFFVYKRYQRIKEVRDRLTRDREAILNAGGGVNNAKLFNGKEIKRATNNFSRDRLLGAGGFGEVYRGILDDGTTIAVKCAKLGNTKGIDQVLNEVRILCHVNHKNLVRLLGCCVELEQPLLVYEYISNGTLLDHLQGKNNHEHLTWAHRLKIAHATAEALAYLHFSAVPPIYHRDVKSSNILLDQKLNAKVSDFGLSRLALTDMSHISTCAQGTLGYLDPEYYKNYQLTDKSDVYSFGVVLLELLTTQKAIDFNRDQDDVNLAIFVQRLVGEEKIMDAVDPVLKEGAINLELETMKALGFLAMGCLEERRQNRPSMKEVVEEIEYLISVATASDDDDEK
ncbi:hypothetical protein DM860_003880 [Cuscuta australis]|uniref:Protein kinase domain-containing protein n=1 Tax=Cuscuta australis TaxID=267555 RepID=A0A328CX53_9ASTE|nr:hypothetical protein DM860_003880 [Cuscuta australis]